MPQQHDPGQLREGLCNVEVAQRANLKEGHTQALGVGLGLFCGHLPLECQVQPVSHQDFRNPRGMLEHEKGKKNGLSGVSPTNSCPPRTSVVPYCKYGLCVHNN